MIVLCFTFTIRQHVVERIVTNALSQTFHPIVLLVLATRRHPVHGVFALDHFTLRVRFASLYEIGAAARVQFETVLLLPILTLSHRYIF